MVFLIQYDRKLGSIVSLTPFEDGVRERAENARLDLELRLNNAGIEHEVVLLEAPSEEDLRRTHRRYFETLVQFSWFPKVDAVRERVVEQDSTDDADSGDE